MIPQNPHTTLITPRENVARGLCTPEQMKSQLALLRRQVARWEKEFPDAVFRFDADDILRVEAREEDACEIDYLLQETVTALTTFEITVRE